MECDIGKKCNPFQHKKNKGLRKRLEDIKLTNEKVAYEPTNPLVTPKASKPIAKFFPFFSKKALFSTTWLALQTSVEAWSLIPRLPKVTGIY